jgi:hypothetical protein
LIGLHDQKRIKKQLGFGLGQELTILGVNINMTLKIEIKKTKVANGLMKDIKSDSIRFFLLYSNS